MTSDGQVLTGNNELFLRYHWEIDAGAVGKNGAWKSHHKGGDFRKWYGNMEWVVAWDDETLEFFRKDKTARIPKKELWDLEGITWSTVTSSRPSFRMVLEDESFNKAAPTLISLKKEITPTILATLNSKVANYVLDVINPTLNYLVKDVESIPLITDLFEDSAISDISSACLRIATNDWDMYERSLGFQTLPMLALSFDHESVIELNYVTWITENQRIITEMRRLEQESNCVFIDAYGLQEELTAGVPIEQITLTVNPAYRYGVKGTVEERNTRFREDTMEELVSYAIGCMMGRYSLDESGLIYANSGNEGFDASRYTKFPADDDGIIPLTDKEWFSDDAANRLVEFISVAWDARHLEENLDFLAANLSPKKGEDSRDTIRRYLCDKFYKDHMQTYKKRPIYWLFSSGKQKAFQCLVYLHRYNESTLARMRTEYVIPLTAKLSSHIEKLENDKGASGSAAEIKKLEKEIKNLHKQQTELTEFDEKLKHYADMRIPLDLDDGVKVNYGKFGDLLSDVKAIHGKAAGT